MCYEHPPYTAIECFAKQYRTEDWYELLKTNPTDPRIAECRQQADLNRANLKKKTEESDDMESAVNHLYEIRDYTHDYEDAVWMVSFRHCRSRPSVPRYHADEENTALTLMIKHEYKENEGSLNFMSDVLKQQDEVEYTEVVEAYKGLYNSMPEDITDEFLLEWYIVRLRLISLLDGAACSGTAQRFKIHH